MKTILLLGALLLIVAVWGTEAQKKQTPVEILDIIHKLSDYRRYSHKGGHGHPVVGFSASLASHVISRRAGQTVVFGNVQSNIGHHYNSRNGIFTAPMDGMYVFQWSILAKNNQAADTSLRVNGQVKRINNVNSHGGHGHGYKSGSALVVLSLKRNDKVWITIQRSGFYAFGRNWSSFNGWLQN